MSSRNGQLAGVRVLIIEDEYFLADDLRNILEAQGAIIVGPIGHFPEAEKQVARDHFDVAV